jgi:hypothetical protein
MIRDNSRNVGRRAKPTKGAMKICLAVLVLIIAWACAGDEPRPLEPIPRTQRLPRPETRRIAASHPAQAATQPAPPPFIIGVWYPPVAGMPVWKARGVNTAIGYEHQSGKVSLDEWINTAAANELFTIRQPRERIADDATDPYLLAWMHIDEPDLKKIDPAPLLDEYGEWKKAAPARPVFLSVSGGGVLFKKTPRAMYQDYFQTADWIANDFYPITGWNEPTWIPRLGEAVEVCRKLSGGKPQFAFIETSSQRLAWMPRETRGVTPDELRAEIWHAVIHGVRGIIYFPQQFNPFVYDATPSPVSVELAMQNRLLAEIGEGLASPANPKGLRITSRPPVEVGWRKLKSGKFCALLLNDSPTPVTQQDIHLVGDNNERFLVTTNGENPLPMADDAFTVDFSIYQVRIFTIEPLGQPPK